jgi:hypothetical protein
MYNDIKAEAKRDAAAWNNPGDPDRGYQQLTTEQLPIRKDQLFNMYGPTGAIPLIPGAAQAEWRPAKGRGIAAAAAAPQQGWSGSSPAPAAAL